MTTSIKPLKFVMLGESKVGKTSIISQYINEEFYQDIQPSLTPQFIKKEIITPDQSSITVDLWDIVGDKNIDP